MLDKLLDATNDIDIANNYVNKGSYENITLIFALLYTENIVASNFRLEQNAWQDDIKKVFSKSTPLLITAARDPGNNGEKTYVIDFEPISTPVIGGGIDIWDQYDVPDVQVKHRILAFSIYQFKIINCGYVKTIVLLTYYSFGFSSLYLLSYSSLFHFTAMSSAAILFGTDRLIHTHAHKF